MEMGTTIRVSTSMECLKGLESTFGRIVVPTRETLNKDREVDMVFGKQTKIE
jgi:hypothetical protein